MVVIAAHHRTLELVTHDAYAFGGGGVVADHIAHRDIIGHTLRTRIGKHCLKRIYVGVYVAEYGVYASHPI